MLNVPGINTNSCTTLNITGVIVAVLLIAKHNSLHLTKLIRSRILRIHKIQYNTILSEVIFRCAMWVQYRVNKVCCPWIYKNLNWELGSREWHDSSVFSGCTDNVLVSTPYRNDWFTWQALYSEHVSPHSQIYDGADMRRGQKIYKQITKQTLTTALT